MSDSTTGRRGFVAKGGAAASLLIVKPQTAFSYQANSALTLGIVGVGNRGTYVAGNIFAKHEFLKVTAFADIYEDKRSAASQKFSGARAFKNHQELLAAPEIDAVYIASPAYLHPEHFEAAVEAKKHIFMEKPAGVDAAGCHRVLRAARKADPAKRISVDLQQRYGKDYRKAYEVVKSGQLGLIKQVRAAWMGGGPAIKSGHAESEEKVRNWFFYRNLSGDILIEQDCHNIDVVNWFTGRHPIRVSGYGSRQIRQYGDIFDNLSCTFQYEGGLVFSYCANQFGNGPAWSDVSETFICEKGSVNVSRRGYTIYRNGQQPETAQTKYDITMDAVNEFIDGALTGKLENAAFHAAESTLTAVMALEACVEGDVMTWNRVREV
ncbi:MAG: Gfo/Idh/MocA family oxidoreductase [Acidobacteria bacterium]|nr:Gfo/Idh/MocA family oxidoreductase [Acidobacteriota bacterium]